MNRIKVEAHVFVGDQRSYIYSEMLTDYTQ